MRYKGSCHCAATTFTVDEKPDSATYCTCSICSKRGALWAYYKPEAVHLDVKDGTESIYRWQTKAVEHHFCSICGCTTFSRSPDFSSGKPDLDNPRIAINIRLFEDFEPDCVPIERIDGKVLW